MTRKDKTLITIIVLVLAAFAANAYVKYKHAMWELAADSLPPNTMGSGYEPLPADAFRVLIPRAPEDYYQGIDISHWQSDIDYPNTCGEFVFIRASAADSACNIYDDSRFAENAAGFTAAGKPWGAYHFFRPNCDAVAQADLFANVLAGTAWTLPPVVDVEVNGGMDAQAVGNAVRTFLVRLEERTGQRGVIYTSPGYWNGNVYAPWAYDYDLWVAHWGVSEPTLPSGWADWLFWQYNVISDGIACGVSSESLDHDVFHGDEADFNERFGDPQPTPTPTPTPQPTPVEGGYPVEIRVTFPGGAVKIYRLEE